jgi:protein-disulfide isomerase
MKKLLFASGAAAVVSSVVFLACTSESARAKPNFVTKDAPKPGVLAKIGGQDISEEELIGEDKMDFFELDKRKHELRMDRLNKLIVDRLVGEEAKKANLPLDEYITKKVVKGEIKISESEYKKFVEEKKIPKEQINPQIKERINTYLQTQKRQDLINSYVAKMTKSNPVEVYFKKPRLEVKVDVGTSPTWGKDNAPVTIIEYSDFQCPFCSRGADVVDALKKKYGTSKIRVAFKHFPLPMHKDAPAASEMSECVREQGIDKFWKFHDVAFKNQDKLEEANLIAYAKQAGADVKKAEECLKSGKHKETVKAIMAEGEKVGVRSTPTFFVNGQMVAGALPVESFSEMIDEELAAKK